MTVFSNNLKMIFGKKRNIFIMLILPILTIFYMITATTQESKYNIAIVDSDKTEFTKTFEEVLETDCSITKLSNQKEIKNMILDRKIDIAIIFDEGFTDRLISGEDVKVENIVLDGTNQNEPLQTNISSFISSAKVIASASDNEKSFYNTLQEFIDQKYVVEYKHFTTSYLEDSENAVTASGYLASCMLFFVMLTTVMLMNERMSGVANRVATTPIKVSSYYFQHFLSYYIVAALQVIIVIGVLPYISILSFGNNFAEVASVMLVGCVFALVCVSIGVFVNSVSKNTFVSGALSTLIELPLLMLGGCLWPKEIMPQFMQNIGKFLPTTWYMTATESLLNEGTLSNNVVEIFTMIGFAAIMLLLTFIIKRKRIADA